MSTDYQDTETDILVCLAVAMGDYQRAKHFTEAYQDGDGSARFVDRFLAEAIECGLVDADSHTMSEAWQEAVARAYPDEAVSTLVEITYPGYAGTFLQPPEDAEVTIWCAECGQETDATTADSIYPDETFSAWCVTGGHDVEVVSQP